MSSNSTYKDSDSEYMVDYSYLAIKDKMIVNKVFEDKMSINGINYGGNFIDEGYIWLRLEDKKGEPLLTALINYSDTLEYEGSLCEALTELCNNDLGDELIQNTIDMIIDATVVCGFTDTYIGDLIVEAYEECSNISIRTVDFGMHLPSYDDLHPFYDT